MTDLQTRFKTLDTLSAPDLWYHIEERAMAKQPTRRSPWVLIAVTLLLALVIGGAVLVGSGIVKLPVSIENSANPSATANGSTHPSADASSSPVEVVPASWTATAQMIEGLGQHTATLLLNGRVLVVGEGPLVSAELYDASSGAWATTGQLAEPRYDHSATLLPDGKVLVAGGIVVNGGPDPSTGVGGAEVFGSASAELYGLATGAWIATGSMIETRCSHTATLLGNGKVLAVGGTNCDSFDPLATAELYDPGTGTWSAAESMAEARSGHTATLLLDGTVLVAGSGTTGASAELYDPASDSWTATGGMLEGRIRHTATRLLDGRVLVAGSMDGTGALASAELYDPSTGQWTPTASMHGDRIYHTATLLPGGKVLVAGGTSSVIDGGQGISAAELYDPDTGSWTVTAEMLEARGAHTATLLSDATVLVTGYTSASAELYDPGSGT